MVSVSLISNGRRICKRQTSVKRKAKDPIFNESLIFSVNDPNDDVNYINSFTINIKYNLDFFTTYRF